MSDIMMPPAALGMDHVELVMAAERKLLVRYWPLRDAPCVPRTGLVLWLEGPFPRGQGWTSKVWLTSTPDCLCSSRCELAEEMVP